MFNWLSNQSNVKPESLKLQQSFFWETLLVSGSPGLLYFLIAVRSPEQLWDTWHITTSQTTKSMTKKAIFVLHQNSCRRERHLNYFLFWGHWTSKIKLLHVIGALWRLKLTVVSFDITVGTFMLRDSVIYFHRDLSVSVAGESAASVCDGFDSLSAWLEHTSFKKGTGPLTLMDFRAILVSEHVSP